MPKCTTEAPETPCTPFTHPVPGGGGTGLIPPRAFLPPKTTFLPNFIKIHPAIWISIENLHIHGPPAPPLVGSNKKKILFLKFDFRENLFYKYFTILKKYFTPLQVPPLTPATLDLGPISKIGLHHFVCLVKCFPKWYDMIQ